MSQIKLKHSGGNSVIIAAPSSNPASDRTITLPSNADGTILTTTNPKAGNILQVVSATKTDRAIINTATFTDVTGMSVAITPTSTSSKIYIAVNVNVGGRNASYNAFKVLRGSTVVTQGTHGTGNKTNMSFGGRIDQDFDNYMVSFNFLDSPSTTSATTYKVQFASVYDSSNRAVVINGNEEDGNYAYTLCGTSTITVMEVAA